ncbi:MAG: bifunctional 5,10-methylenetetrahydrofolate dehydrogenase/5,10-methenyltetrahydrofolate cyclohydrolase [Ktedonobacterales bacterium]|nr:bifunctional 5,10-methylenetetrahydrofolate dehydrogenase/5,10-methenyltetrahydrofolate cyclohydrolase [Ktedonobacterales bacterium]
MSAAILDGRVFAAEIARELGEHATARQTELGYTPTLAIVVVRDQIGDSASDVYVRQLRRTARQVGLNSRLVELSTRSTPTDVLDAIARLNDEPAVHGIIVQLPLPPHLGRDLLLDAIAPEKDVDGIGATNAGNLFLNLPAKVPATCAAVMELLDRTAVVLDGRRVVIVGASAVVGRPLALMLLRRDATVSVCHIYTQDLPTFTRQADVLIAAAGVPRLIRAEMVQPGAVVIDVGINVLADGRVVGDVDFEPVCSVAGAITPVPGGVGPLTNLMVMRQTLERITA